MIPATAPQRGVANSQREYSGPHAQLTGRIIGAAIEVHRGLGPGLLESAYEECMCHELHLRQIPFRRQVELPVVYKNVRLDCGYRMDLLVDDAVVVELKAVEKWAAVFEAQLITYLRLSGKRVGLLINFGAPALSRGGIIRRVL
jgi:GxxExxY protein